VGGQPCSASTARWDGVRIKLVFALLFVAGLILVPRQVGLGVAAGHCSRSTLALTLEFKERGQRKGKKKREEAGT
jgi:hypothetical protein